MMSIVWLIGLTLATVSAPAAALRCAGGGGGGVPFSLMPSSPTLNWRPIYSYGNVMEISVLNEINSFFYRNHAGEVWELDTKHESQLPRIWNTFTSLSRVMQGEGRYIANQAACGRMWTFERARNYLSQIGLPSTCRQVTQLFWNGNSLYLLEDLENSGDYHQYGIIQADRKTERANTICSLSMPKTLGIMGIVKGTQYPFVTFYAYQSPGPDSSMKLIHVNVDSCHVHATIENGPSIESPVQSITYFPKTNAYGIFFERGLTWWNELGCKDLNSESFHLIPLNSDKPLLIGWSRNEELSLLDPENETRAVLLKGLGIQELSESRTWFLKNSVYVAPQLSGEYWRSLIRIDLKKPYY